MEDEDVIRVVKSGHVESYSIIVDRYKNMVYDLCYKYTYDYNESQDLSQEIFFKAYRKLESFRNSSSFSTWLYRIGINTCIDWTRKNKRIKNHKSLNDEEIFDRLPSDEPVPEEVVVDYEKKEHVRDMIVSLPEKYRAVVILYNYKNLSCSEISEILDIPVKTVETRLYRAKKMLKDRLLKTCGGGEYVWNAVK